MKKAKRSESAGRLSARAVWRESLLANRAPLATCGLALLIYLPSLFCGFIRDDYPQIVNNRQVQSWEYLPQLLGSHLWSQIARDETILFYRPIFSVWMLLLHTIGGLEPWFWHLSNLLLHGVATYLVYRFCRRLTGSGAGAVAAAAIFAVHPIHVEAVTWVSASCEILCTIFALAAMQTLLHDNGDNDDNKNVNRQVWISALWFGAALFAKETGIAMLAILPVLAWVRLRDMVAGKERFWKAGYPYGAVAACYLLIRWAVMRRMGMEIGEHSWAEVIFSGPSILLYYWKKLFVPLELSGCYVTPLTGSPTPLFWLQVAGILIFLAATAWLAFRYRPLLALAAALIVIPVLLALAVIRVYPQGDMTHDRYLYLPSIGLSLLVAMLVEDLWSRGRSARTAVMAVGVAVVAAFSALTFTQQKYYHDDMAFCLRVIAVSPSDAFAHGQLGNLYLDQGRVDVALEQFWTGHQLDPGNEKVTLFLARGLFVAGQYKNSETVLRELLQTKGLSTRRRNSAQISLANVEISLGNLADAQQLLEQVERRDGHFPELHWAWGVLYQKQGMLPQAQAEFEKEFEITGDLQAQQRSALLARLIYSQSKGQVH